MKNFTPELIAEAKTAKSAEELLALAKANNVELTAEEAKTYWEQLNAIGTMSDDELDVVAGGDGLSCPSEEENDGSVSVGGFIQKCKNCGRIARVGSRCKYCSCMVV